MTDTTNKTPTEILAPDVATPEVVPAQAPKPGKPTSLWSDAWKELRRKPGFIISALIIIVMMVMAIFPQLFTSVDPGIAVSSMPFRHRTQNIGSAPTCRVATTTPAPSTGPAPRCRSGLVVTFFATLIAVSLGSLSGYKGGWLDSVMSRFTDIMFAIPLILAGIVFLNALGSKGFWTV